MASPSHVGCRNCWWITLILAAGSLAAPQHDRRILTVGTNFGTGRALSDEPTLITEPLPGHEFVFISATPGQSHLSSPVVGGRAGRLGSSSFGSSDWADRTPLPSVRIQQEANVPTLLDEDGILVAAHEFDDAADAQRFGRQLNTEIETPASEGVDHSWQSFSLSELLNGSAIVLRPPNAHSTAPAAAEGDPISTSEQFTPEDALSHTIGSDGNQVPHSEEDNDASQAETALPGARHEEDDRDAKAIHTRDDILNVIPAESVSSRTVIKTAANGQDYEYEYLYYDDAEVEGTTSSSVVNQSEEPSLLVADQVSAAISSKSEAIESSSEAASSPPFTESEVTEEPVEAHLEPEEVDEPIQVAKVAFTVGSDVEETTESADPVTTGTIVDAHFATETEAPITSTTTTTTVAPATKRVRPSRPTEESKNRSKSTTARPKKTESDGQVLDETLTKNKSTRPKSRLSSASRQPLNGVGSEGKSESSGRRNKVSSKATHSSNSPLENRAGIPEGKTKFADFDLDKLFDLADQDQTAVGETEEETPLISSDLVPNSRFPSRFPVRDEEDAANERESLRAIDSSSFRNSAAGSSSGEQLSAGRLTIISGPARLPVPVHSQFDSAELVPEEDDVVSPTTAVAPSTASTHEEAPITPHIIQAQPFDESLFTSLNVDRDAGELGHFEESTSGEVPEVSVAIEEPHESIGRDESVETVKLTPSRPELFDLLAFSRAAEQQQHDEKMTTVPEIEEVLIEEVHSSPTTDATEAELPETATHATDEIVHEADEVDETPVIGATPVESGNDKNRVPNLVTSTVVSFVEEQGAGDAVTESEHDEHPDTTEPTPIAVHNDTPVFKITEPFVLDTNDEVETTEKLPVMTADAVQTEDVADEENTTELSSSTAATTKAPTTTTTVATTTITTTTEAPQRGRGQSRFTAANQNNNRFANKIRNRVRDGNVTTTTTTTTTAAPSTRKSSGFSRTSALNSRLRRPGGSTTASTNTVDAEPSTDDFEASTDEQNDSTKGVDSISTTTTRRPLTPSIRNRFNIRNRLQLTGEERSSLTPSTQTENRTPLNSTPRTRPSPQSSGRVVVSPRPSILQRGRSTSTTTTTTESAPADVGDEIDSVLQQDDGEANDSEGSSSTATTTTTTTTTNKPVGLNRLKNRVSIAVSERPKPVRNQVSLTDRRNRFTALNSKKPLQDQDDLSEDASVKVVVVEGLPKEKKHVTDESTAASEQSAIEVAFSSPLPLRSLRHNRRPGQLAARRPPSF